MKARQHATRRKRTAAYERRKKTAYHEAGHAVIGRVLTLPCGEASIKRNYAERTEGHSITPSPHACEWAWEKRGKVRGDNAVWHARIITLMAGAESEKACLGQEALGDDDDRYQILLMFDEIRSSRTDWESYEARLRAMTGMLVRRHQARIRRVAQALLAKRRLSTEELDRLVGRSVADVKVNAPRLLEMHAQAEAEQWR
jgi:hypothetical protein